MTINTDRRFTAGPPENDLPTIVGAIHRDAMAHWERIESGMSKPLDTRSALGIMLYNALDELASYWPPQEFADDLNRAMLDLRCQILHSLRGDAKPAEVLRHAAQTIAQLRQDIAHQAELLRDQQEEITQLRAADQPPHYDWSGTTASPNIALTVAPDGGLLVSSSLSAAAVTIGGRAGEDDETVGVAVAAPTLEPSAIDWTLLCGPDLPAEKLETLINGLEDGPPEGLLFRKLSATTRRMLAIHALGQLDLRYDGNLLMRQFDQDRPSWMPTASALVAFFDLNWPSLLEIVRRSRS
jgi:hypothetical protein